MRARLAALTIFFTALLATGCGGTSTSTSSQADTKAKLIASVEAICVRHDVAAAAAAIAATSDSEVKRDAKTRLANERLTLTQLNALTVPTSMQPRWKPFIASRQTVIAELLKMSRYGLVAPGGTSIDRLANALEAMIAAGRRAGFRECAREY